MLHFASNKLGIITNALCAFLPMCPPTLQWERWISNGSSCKTQCFQARGSDQSVYSVNAMTGEVLVTGLPPSRLPSSILNHPLYARSFGDRQFEVMQKEGFLVTCRPAFDKFYKFSLESELKIYEFEDGSGVLELLDHDTSKWSRDLPARLAEMHSQWLHRDRNLVVLRGKRFRDRKVSFVIKLIGDSKKAQRKGEVKCVSLHWENRDLSEVLNRIDSMDTLMVHQSPVLDILSKFEPKEFIHTMISSTDSNSTMKLYLRRFKWTLQLVGGVLKSQAIAGYQLAKHQQTDDTLRGSSRYLLLEKSGGVGRKMIVFPQGQVTRNSDGFVDVHVTKRTVAVSV